MKRLTANLRNNSAYDQNSSREGSQNKVRLTCRSKSPWLSTRLPFVLVLTVLSAIVAAGLTFSNWPSRSGRVAVIDQHRKGVVKADAPKQTAQPKTSALSVGSAKLDDRASFENKLFSKTNAVKP